MEQHIFHPRERAILDRLSSLPRKIMSMHDHPRVVELVMHELVNDQCFNLDLAAYIIDNPDFDCLKGVAGITKEEQYPEHNVWKNPASYCTFMDSVSFNGKVKNIMFPSSIKQGKSDEYIARQVADELAIINPLYYSWRMKHDNHGILIYKHADLDEKIIKLLHEGAVLLSFCPIA